MSNSGKKDRNNPAGKPSRQEIATVLQPIAEQAQRAYMGLCDLTDLLISKNVTTIDELKAWIAKAHAPAQPEGTIAQAQEAALGTPPLPTVDNPLAIPPADRETVLSQAALDAQEAVADATGFPE